MAVASGRQSAGRQMCEAVTGDALLQGQSGEPHLTLTQLDQSLANRDIQGSVSGTKRQSRGLHSLGGVEQPL